MRVLHVGKYHPPFSGGIERFMADLAEAQARSGLSVFALVHHHDRGSASTETEKRGVYLRRVRSFGRLLYVPISPGFGRELAKMIEAVSPDVIHIHMPNPSAFWLLFSRRAKRIPWVVHWHSDVVTEGAERAVRWAYRLYRPMEQMLLRRAAAVIVTSPPYLAASKPLNRHRDKTEVIPLGIDPGRLTPVSAAARKRAKRTWQEGCLRVLTVGRLTCYKGHAVLLDAVAKLPHVQLCIVGGGEGEASLRGQIAKQALDGRVHLLGRLSDADVAAMYESCDCFCLASTQRTEAFGVVLLEAMQFGRAVVATRVAGSGVAWVVQDRRTGLLVPSGHAEALASAIAELAGDESMRQRLGQAGRVRFEATFDIAQTQRMILGTYQRVVDSGSSSERQ